MVVYKTTNNINGKIYVGQDLHNNPKYLGSGKIFKQSLKKYGIENFTKEILEYCKTKEELNEKEIYWIEELKSRERHIGYNICSGGVYGNTISNNPNKEEICKKISIANKGKKRTIEQRQRISESQKGRIISEETKQKMSKTRKERNIKNSKKNIEITKKRLKDNYSGENNINAKTFYLISPDEKHFTVIGQLPTFCIENNINVNVLRNYINKGKIPKTNRYETELRNNTIGWEIKTDLNIIGEYDKYFYILKNPDEVEFTIFHGLRKFCKDNILHYDSFILNMNKGKIKYPLRLFTIERINTTNWQIMKIESKNINKKI